MAECRNDGLPGFEFRVRLHHGVVDGPAFPGGKQPEATVSMSPVLVVRIPVVDGHGSDVRRVRAGYAEARQQTSEGVGRHVLVSESAEL